MMPQTEHVAHLVSDDIVGEIVQGTEGHIATSNSTTTHVSMGHGLVLKARIDVDSEPRRTGNRHGRTNRDAEADDCLEHRCRRPIPSHNRRVAS